MTEDQNLAKIDSGIAQITISNYLDDDRENFCRQIVARKGLVASYKECIDKNISDEGAKTQALYLASIPEVCKRIEKLEKERLVYRNITKESLVVGLKEIHDVSIADYYDETLSCIKRTSEWTPAMRLAAKKVKQTKFGVELEIQGKEFIVDKISAIMGFNAPTVNVEVKGEFSQYSDEELAKLAGVEDVKYEEVV